MWKKRDLSSYSDKEKILYNDLMEQGEALFKKQLGTTTIFYQILLDRVADAYISLLGFDKESTSSVAQVKATQDKLQKWLAMSFSELHSTSAEQERRKKFFEEVAEIVNEVILEGSIRKKLFKRFADLLDK